MCRYGIRNRDEVTFMKRLRERWCHHGSPSQTACQNPATECRWNNPTSPNHTGHTLVAVWLMQSCSASFVYVCGYNPVLVFFCGYSSVLIFCSYSLALLLCSYSSYSPVLLFCSYSLVQVFFCSYSPELVVYSYSPVLVFCGYSLVLVEVVWLVDHCLYRGIHVLCRYSRYSASSTIYWPHSCRWKTLNYTYFYILPGWQTIRP